jgi:tRNA threonylcarbamoyladenosine biosynthesis protein TsaB
MSLILHIQTALEKAMVGIGQKGMLLAARENAVQKEHASFLQPAIRELCRETGIGLRDLSAVSVVAGPGSYTGLRVGMAGAKGLCFALDKPLISFNTLRWMASAGAASDARFLCPMLDARRMEVYTAVYTPGGVTIRNPCAAILDEKLFDDLLEQGKTIFFGGGTAKFHAIMKDPNAVFENLEAGQEELAMISWNLYQSGVFSDLKSTAPLYLKDFHSTMNPSGL